MGKRPHRPAARRPLDFSFLRHAACAKPGHPRKGPLIVLGCCLFLAKAQIPLQEGVMRILFFKNCELLDVLIRGKPLSCHVFQVKIPKETKASAGFCLHQSVAVRLRNKVCHAHDKKNDEHWRSKSAAI